MDTNMNKNSIPQFHSQSWSFNALATWCEQLTHLKRPWCWERLKAGGEGDDRGSDGWMASPILWTWVWVNSGSWWWTGRTGVLQSMGSQKVGHDWVTELKLEGGAHLSKKVSYQYFTHDVIRALIFLCLYHSLSPTPNKQNHTYWLSTGMQRNIST